MNYSFKIIVKSARAGRIKVLGFERWEFVTALSGTLFV